MRLPTSVVRLVLAATAFAAPAFAASAQNVTFSGAGTFGSTPTLVPGLAAGPFSFAITLPQSPTPSVPNTIDVAEFIVNGVTGTFTQGTTTTAVTSTFAGYLEENGGGFSFGTSGNMLIVSPFSTQVFTGTGDAPTFVLGAYTVTENDRLSQGTLPIGSTVTVAPAATAAVPEPSTVLLTGAGAVALAGVAARRRRAVA